MNDRKSYVGLVVPGGNVGSGGGEPCDVTRCGRGDVALSHSHILSQATRKDLAAEKDNIKLHCLGNYYSCHETWERGIPHEIVLMDDFKENLAYIEMVDRDKFVRIMIKLEEANIKI